MKFTETIHEPLAILHLNSRMWFCSAGLRAG